MFYDKFIEQCTKKGVSRTKACVDCGVSRTAWRKWEDGGTPNGTTINRFADYFGVTAGYLLGAEKSPSEVGEGRAIDVVDDELREYLDELRSRPEKKLLFSVTKNATKEQIEAIVKMVEAMQDDK